MRGIYEYFEAENSRRKSVLVNPRLQPSAEDEKEEEDSSAASQKRKVLELDELQHDLIYRLVEDDTAASSGLEDIYAVDSDERGWLSSTNNPLKSPASLSQGLFTPQQEEFLESMMPQLLYVQLLDWIEQDDLKALQRLSRSDEEKRTIDWNWSCEDEEGKSLLAVAATRSSLEVIAFLLTQPGLDLQQRDKSGSTALLDVCKYRQQDTIHVVQLLLEAGADVNAHDQFGTTALMLASERGAVDVVMCLLQHEVDLNMQDKAGCTALMKACWKGHFDVVFSLLQDSRKQSPRLDPNLQNKEGHTAMMLSVLAIAAHGDQSRRQCLILKYLSSQSGFDKHIQNHQGDTVLSMARRLYLFEVLDILGGGDDDEKLGWGSEEVKSSLEPLSPSKQLTALQFLKSIGNKDELLVGVTDLLRVGPLVPMSPDNYLDRLKRTPVEVLQASFQQTINTYDTSPVERLSFEDDSDPSMRFSPSLLRKIHPSQSLTSPFSFAEHRLNSSDFFTSPHQVPALKTPPSVRSEQAKQTSALMQDLLKLASTLSTKETAFKVEKTMTLTSSGMGQYEVSPTESEKEEEEIEEFYSMELDYVEFEGEDGESLDGAEDDFQLPVSIHKLHSFHQNIDQPVVEKTSQGTFFVNPMRASKHTATVAGTEIVNIAIPSADKVESTEEVPEESPSLQQRAHTTTTLISNYPKAKRSSSVFAQQSVLQPQSSISSGSDPGTCSTSPSARQVEIHQFVGNEEALTSVEISIPILFSKDTVASNAKKEDPIVSASEIVEVGTLQSQSTEFGYRDVDCPTLQCEAIGTEVVIDGCSDLASKVAPTEILDAVSISHNNESTKVTRAADNSETIIVNSRAIEEDHHGGEKVLKDNTNVNVQIPTELNDCIRCAEFEVEIPEKPNLLQQQQLESVEPLQIEEISEDFDEDTASLIVFRTSPCVFDDEESIGDVVDNDNDDSELFVAERNPKDGGDPSPDTPIASLSSSTLHQIAQLVIEKHQIVSSETSNEEVVSIADHKEALLILPHITALPPPSNSFYEDVENKEQVVEIKSLETIVEVDYVQHTVNCEEEIEQRHCAITPANIVDTTEKIQTKTATEVVIDEEKVTVWEISQHLSEQPKEPIVSSDVIECEASLKPFSDSHFISEPPQTPLQNNVMDDKSSQSGSSESEGEEMMLSNNTPFASRDENDPVPPPRTSPANGTRRTSTSNLALRRASALLSPVTPKRPSMTFSIKPTPMPDLTSRKARNDFDSGSDSDGSEPKHPATSDLKQIISRSKSFTEARGNDNNRMRTASEEDVKGLGAFADGLDWMRDLEAEDPAFYQNKVSLLGKYHPISDAKDKRTSLQQFLRSVLGIQYSIEDPKDIQTVHVFLKANKILSPSIWIQVSESDFNAILAKDGSLAVGLKGVLRHLHRCLVVESQAAIPPSDDVAASGTSSTGSQQLQKLQPSVTRMIDRNQDKEFIMMHKRLALAEDQVTILSDAMQDLEDHHTVLLQQIHVLHQMKFKKKNKQTKELLTNM